MRRINERELELTVTPDLGALAPGISVRFLNQYKARHSVQEVERELARIIEATLSRIKNNVQSERTALLQKRWLGLSNDRLAALAEATARLGLDVDSLEESDRALIRQHLDHPDRAALWALAEGSSARTVKERLSEALKLWNQLPSTPPVSDSWQEAQQRVARKQMEAPWYTGWLAAERFRDALGLSEEETAGHKLPRVLEERLDWPAAAQVFSSQPLVQGADTVHVRLRSRMPAVMTTVPQEPARNFRLARSTTSCLPPCQAWMPSSWTHPCCQVS